MAQSQSFPMRWLRHVDQGLNVYFGWYWNWYYSVTYFGFEDELVSSVLGKMIKQNYDTGFRRGVDWFFLKILNQQDHCIKSIENDEGFVLTPR